jgi:hypothetical protein
MGMDRIKPEQLKGAKKLLGDFLKDESGKEISPDAMVKALRATLTGMTLYAAIPSGAAATEAHTKPHIEHQINAESFSKHDFELVAKNVYYEAGGEPSPEAQLAVAQITFASLLSKRWGATIHATIYAKNRFSWTPHEKNRKPSPQDAQNIAKLADVFALHFKGKSAAEIVRELSAITGLPPETLYYKRADWDEGDPNETRMTEGTKKVFQSLVWVKNIDKHAFYIDPPQEARVAQRR